MPGYNYLGPGTRLDIRLTKNNIPKLGEEPINEIDRLAYIHDLAYQKSSNIQDRHRADLARIEGLKGLKNLSFPQKLIKFMIIKLFQAEIKLGHGTYVPPQLTLQGQGTRAAKTQAIENLYKQPDVKTKYELEKLVNHTEKLKELIQALSHGRKILANELHKPFRRPKQLKKINF